MTRQSVENLHAFLTDRAGGLLRVLLTYDGDGYEIHHRRQDLDRDCIEARSREVYENLTVADTASDDRLASDVGTLDASLQVRSKAVIVHLPLDGGRGVVVSLEPEAGRDLTTFLGACIERL